MPEPAPLIVPPEDVIKELVTDPLGRALWERAQWRVAADMLQRRVVELEAEQVGGPAPMGPTP
jgi:hypothetical protein